MQYKVTGAFYYVEIVREHHRALIDCTVEADSESEAENKAVDAYIGGDSDEVRETDRDLCVELIVLTPEETAAKESKERYERLMAIGYPTLFEAVSA